jgi:uncharacterized damage-inducible protein DinB
MTTVTDVAPVRDLFPDWPQYNDRLVAAIRDLTADQLALSAGPDHGTIWQLAAHTAGARVYWLCGIVGEPGPFPNPGEGLGWEDDVAHPRSGEELAWAFGASWDVIASCLGRWTRADLARTVSRDRDGTPQVHTYGSILNRLFSHDAFHAGEISQLLGVHGLGEIDLWRRD